MLRPEIKRGFATLHVERHRAMLMRDQPLVFRPAVTGGLAPPHIEFLPGCRYGADMVEAMAESYSIANSDVQVPNLQANRTLERGEPFL